MSEKSGLNYSASKTELKETRCPVLEIECGILNSISKEDRKVTFAQRINKAMIDCKHHIIRTMLFMGLITFGISFASAVISEDPWYVSEINCLVIASESGIDCQ